MSYRLVTHFAIFHHSTDAVIGYRTMWLENWPTVDTLDQAYHLLLAATGNTEEQWDNYILVFDTEKNVPITFPVPWSFYSGPTEDPWGATFIAF